MDSNLLKLFGSSSRVKILELLLNNAPENSFRVTEIRVLTNINPRMISVEMRNLIDLGIVVKEVVGKTPKYSIDPTSPLYAPLEEIFKPKNEWSEWERPSKIHHLIITLIASQNPMKEYYGFHLPTAHLVFNQDTVTWYFNKDAFIETGKDLLNFYKKNREKIWKDFNDNAKSLGTHNSYKSFYTNYINYWKIAYITEPISFYIDSLLSPSEQIVLTKKSFSEKYEDDLWELAKQAEKVGLEKLNTNNFLKKYFWIRNSYHGEYKLTHEDVLLELKKKIGKTKPVKKAIKNDNLHIPKSLIKIGEDMIYMQDLRKMHMMKATHYLYKHLENFSNKNNIKLSDVEQTVPSELLNYDSEIGTLKKNLELRRNGCTVIGKIDKDLQIYNGKRLAPELNSNKFTKTLKGRSACGGKVVGKAKLVTTIEDIQKVNHGDIIVSQMTTPDFMPAIRRCEGIVTDYGGITCHAAIIAREFNIPTVVATNTATKVIKNGDVIEVDADSGIVNILNPIDLNKV